MKPLASLAPLILPIFAGANDDSSSIPRPTATLESGVVFGVQTSLPNALWPVKKFLGVPYAGKPERFSRAKKHRGWKKARGATEFGPSCHQYFVDNDVAPGKDINKGLFGGNSTESEDCLFINAFAPASPPPKGGRPVVVFIHGGGWQQGNGILDLSGFAGYEDIVTFSFNYRTNVFGFPNAPGMAPDAVNLGLYDQRLAIEWVQANAAAFGGDPQKVTIWGESAGALSVDIHVNAYGDDGPPPFRAASMFSGQMSVGFLGSTMSATDHTYWNALARVAGCDDVQTQLACLRRIPAEKLIELMGEAGAAFMPIVDNVTLPSGRAERWREGKTAKVPVLMGTIAQEGRALVNRNINLTEFVEAYLPEELVNATQREKILKVYAADAALKTDFDTAAAIYTDYFWQCPQGILANISASIDNPTWRYYFNASVTSLLPPEYAWLGKFHGSDALLLFGTPSFEGDSGGFALTPQLYTLANYLRGVVGRFVRNPAGGPGWPAVASRYAPFDVANLGDVGGDIGVVAGATVVDERVLDERCGLYEDIYPLIEEFALS
ncbi:Alpha/Beta hydrolase protein [Thelonectria olida]|uniref:Carboxylic ester hydrolase n=1 Tax=Thelonectria olida TaxID=1576542 RepID=A0A9P9AP65_9HYPO|nr:Alpha/Beta hydrolase protein [Thelonectria olida]